MTDIVDKQTRSRMMAGIQGKDGAKVETRMPETVTARAMRSLCGRGWDLRDMAHAALRSGVAAAWINCRIARLLNRKEISAEAW